MKFKKHPCDIYQQKKCKLQISLTGLSGLLHKEISIVYSRGALQTSGIRRFGIKVSLLSPLRPILRDVNPLLKFLGNALTFERVLKRSKPSHLWATGRPPRRCPTRQQLPRRPAHGHTCNVASPTKPPPLWVGIRWEFPSLQDSRGVEERDTLDCYNYVHGYSSVCA